MQDSASAERDVCGFAESRLGEPCGGCTVRGLTICAPLSLPDLRIVSRFVSGRMLAPGEALFEEGDQAEYLYNITAGTMMVYRLLPDGRRQVTGFLFPGDFLGFGSDDIHRYTAESVTEARLCRFRRIDLQQVIERFPDMGKRLFGLAGHELAAAQDQMMLLGRKTAQEKLASFLLMLSERALKRGQKGSPIGLPMSRSQIADYLGLTIETTSRLFTKLKKSGVIAELPPAKVEIRDRDRLSDLAEGRG